MTLKSDGPAAVQLDLPASAGSARVMGIAWTRDKLGHAVGDVTIRDPVVVTATLPRFLLTGDRGTMHLEVDNVEGAAGEYAIAVTAQGAVGVGERATQTLPLRQKQRSSVSVPLSASAAGTVTM